MSNTRKYFARIIWIFKVEMTIINRFLWVFFLVAFFDTLETSAYYFESNNLNIHQFSKKRLTELPDLAVRNVRSYPLKLVSVSESYKCGFRIRELRLVWIL